MKPTPKGRPCQCGKQSGCMVALLLEDVYCTEAAVEQPGLYTNDDWGSNE